MANFVFKDCAQGDEQKQVMPIVQYRVRLDLDDDLTFEIYDARDDYWYRIAWIDAMDGKVHHEMHGFRLRAHAGGVELTDEPR